MSATALLVACSAALDPGDPRQAAWLDGAVDRWTEQLDPAVVLVGDVAPGDGWMRRRLADRGAAFLLYMPHNVRLRHRGHRCVATAPWAGRSADLAMVRDLVRAHAMRWNVYALTLVHAGVAPDDLRPLYTFLDWHRRPGLLGNPEEYTP